MNPGAEPVQLIVLDTNIVLDLFVFKDPASLSLKQALQCGKVRWLATQAMREELERVLSYPKIESSLDHDQGNLADVLRQFDELAQIASVAPRAPVRCSDADDQKFIDLALAHQATLLSKDRAVLSMRKRLATLGVRVKSHCTGAPP